MTTRTAAARRLAALLLTSLLGAVLVAVPGAAPATAAFPFPLPTAPQGDVEGVNDWACAPTAQRPVPVVVVHGTFGDRRNILEPLLGALLEGGWCTWSLDYGNRGTGDVATSAKQLKRFVGRVREATGAEKVSLVGHSQGGMMPRYYVKFLRGARHVDDLVGIAPSNHGTALTASPLQPLLQPLLDVICFSCSEQATGSPFLQRLNAGDETPGRVSYTQITTRNDQVVVPHTSGYLEEGPRTTNVTIQDACPLALAEHLFVPSSPVTIAYVLDALSRRGPADPALEPACAF